jgi:hypothetical protein
MGVRGITGRSSLADGVDILGQPFKTGGGTMSPGILIHPWAKFRLGDRRLHIEFWTRSGRIKAVTF